MCQHPLDDAVTVTYTVATRDFMAGLQRLTTGFYCPRHRRYGHWTVVSELQVPVAVQALVDSKEDLFGPH